MGKEFVLLLPQEQRQVMDCKFQFFSALKWAWQHLILSQGGICSGLALTALPAIPESSQTSMQLLQWRCICSHLQECHRAESSDCTWLRQLRNEAEQSLRSAVETIAQQHFRDGKGTGLLKQHWLHKDWEGEPSPTSYLSCCCQLWTFPDSLNWGKMKVMSSSGQGYFFGQICTLHPLQDCTVQPHSKNKTPKHQYSSKQGASF